MQFGGHLHIGNAVGGGSLGNGRIIYLCSGSKPGGQHKLLGSATVSHSIVVNAAVLTVIANNSSRSYGAANPAFTQSYSVS